MKKKYTILYFLAVLLVGIAVACSGESTVKANEKTQDVAIEPGEDTTARESGFFERTKKHPFNNTLIGQYKLAKKKAKYVTFFVQTYRGTFFLAQNKPELYNDDYKLDKKIRFGLIDANGNQLLPTVYEKISNPGFILDDYMEVCKDGKSGLYNYAGKKLIAAEYDDIYPSSIMEYIAIGQKGNAFFKIYADGTSKAFKDDQPAPNYVRLLKTYQLNIENDRFGLWVETGAMELSEEEYYPEYSRGMLSTPSYLDRLDFFPKLVTGIILPWADYDQRDSISATVSDSRNRNESTYSMITSFFSYSAESRGFESQERYLMTFDRKNTVKSRIKVLEWDNYFMQNSCDMANPSIRFMNDSVVEVKNYLEIPANAAIPYERYTKYEYYSIAADGKVTAVSKGFFPMTSAIELKRSHFNGCFVRPLELEEAMTMNDELSDEDYGGELYGFRDHLTAADLEYMRNEIYARHGLKFKDAKWAAVFKTMKWYKGTSSNVDAKLTAIEKKNLQLIKQLEKELKANPEKLVHEEARYFEMAG